MYLHLNTFIQLVSYIGYLNIWGRLAGYSLGLNSNNQNKTNNQSFLGRQCQARSLACSWGWPPRTPSSSPPPSSCSVGIFNLWTFLLSSCVVGILNLWEKRVLLCVWYLQFLITDFCEGFTKGNRGLQNIARIANAVTITLYSKVTM